MLLYWIHWGFWVSALAFANAISTSQRWSASTGAAWAIRGGAISRDDTPYSFSLTTFSPRGSLTQIEYASNAVLVRSPLLEYNFHRGYKTRFVWKTQHMQRLSDSLPHGIVCTVLYNWLYKCCAILHCLEWKYGIVEKDKYDDQVQAREHCHPFAANLSRH